MSFTDIGVKEAAAGLSGPAQSSVKALPDGRHMLVFLSPAPLADDNGNDATLPHGRRVSLREQFPYSGCYPIGATNPVWTAPWDDTDVWVVSEDSRYLVRWNIFGDGAYSQGAKASWALKFYDNGREIAHWDTEQLVDLLPLMPFTTWDYHYAWFGNSQDNFSLSNNRLLVQTSTHDRYLFDVATGKIISERHLWRPLMKLVAAAVSGIVLLATFKWRPGFNRRKNRTAAVGDLSVFVRTKRDRNQPKTFSFSLKKLLIVATAVSMACGLLVKLPQVAVFALAIASAVTISYRLRQSARRIGSLQNRSLRYGLLYPAAVCLWFSVYVLSPGPVLGLLHRFRAGDDVRIALGLTIYYPLELVATLLPSDVLRPLDAYMDSWHRLLR